MAIDRERAGIALRELLPGAVDVIVAPFVEPTSVKVPSGLSVGLLPSSLLLYHSVVEGSSLSLAVAPPVFPPPTSALPASGEPVARRSAERGRPQGTCGATVGTLLSAYIYIYANLAGIRSG